MKNISAKAKTVVKSSYEEAAIKGTSGKECPVKPEYQRGIH
jgi:hypothetical protein